MTDVFNPATEERITAVDGHTVDSTRDAIGRASDAFRRWRATPPAERAELLRAFARAVDADIEHLARLEVAEAGHTISNARGEAANVRDVLSYFAGGVERHLGEQIPVAGGIDVTFNEPLGVIGIIVPWNFPMPIAGWGFAPALAAGNTVVAKPGRVPPGDRREYFRRAAAHCARLRPAGYRPPAGVDGVRTELLGQGRYAAYQAVRALAKARRLVNR